MDDHTRLRLIEGMVTEIYRKVVQRAYYRLEGDLFAVLCETDGWYYDTRHPDPLSASFTTGYYFVCPTCYQRIQAPRKVPAESTDPNA